jgi:orotidine-5'-phosphate decarboxylase
MAGLEVQKSAEVQPQENNFNTKLDQRQVKLNSLLCVGLDLDTLNAKFPQRFIDKYGDVGRGLREMGIAIVNNTYDIASAYKPNISFFEMHGDAGEHALEEIIEHIREKSPSTPIILDSKRTDIGNTNGPYVLSAFDRYGVDATTVNPYFGGEALDPFFARKDKGIIVLCRTSNKGAMDIQYEKTYLKDLPADMSKYFIGLEGVIEGVGRASADTEEITSLGFIRVYQKIAYLAAKEWNRNGNVSLVVGATAPEELAKVRKIVGDEIKILAPGLGASQGGRPEDIARGFNSRKRGVIANMSRAIDFPDINPGETYEQAVRREAIKWRDAINVYR